MYGVTICMFPVYDEVTFGVFVVVDVFLVATILSLRCVAGK